MHRPTSASTAARFLASSCATLVWRRELNLKAKFESNSSCYSFNQ